MVTGLRKITTQCIIVSSILILSSSIIADLTSLSKHDPYPVFTAIDPLVDRLLITKDICDFRNEYIFRARKNNLVISVSPFRQSATRGANGKGEKIFRRVPIQLGDLTGRWGLVPLVFGPLPIGQTPTTYMTDYPTLQEIFTNAADNKIVPTGSLPGQMQVTDGYKVDPNQRCGFFSVPLKYSKTGVRFSLSARSSCSGFGFNIEGGVSSISQTQRDICDPYCLEPLCDITPSPSAQPVIDFQGLDLTTFHTKDDLVEFIPTMMDPDPCKNIIGITTENIQKYLTRPFDCIAQEIKLDIDDFCAISAEELRFNLFWNEVYTFNPNSYEWSHLAIIPSFMVSASVSPGKVKDEHKAFALYFGNNKHVALGFSAGLYLDFAETVQVGGEVGYTHFFKRTYDDLRIPTSKFQTGVFPFFANAEVQPGDNTYFSLKMLAYHFLDNLSVFVQYNQVQHKPDKICLVRPDPAFVPHVLERVTSWNNKSINAGATYDLLPNFGVGFLWQVPVLQRNSYRSTTIMLSLYGFF